MALKDLTIATMITITAAWLDPARERSILTKLTRVQPLVDDIEAAHEALLRVGKGMGTAAAGAASLSKKAADLDARHDRLARGLYNTLTGLADLTDDGNGAALLAARDELMPDGLAIVGRSYVDEAGEAELVERRLSAASRKLLKGTSLAGKSLAKHVATWIATARELGIVERERIRHQSQTSERPSAAADTVRARNEWIRTVNAVLQMLTLEKALDDASRQRVVEALDAAQRKANRRATKAKAERTDEPSDGEDTEPSLPAVPVSPAN